MKRRDITALHGKSKAELEKELAGKEREINKLRLERKTKQVKNTRLITNLKDDVARIATVIKLVAEKENKV